MVDSPPDVAQNADATDRRRTALLPVSSAILDMVHDLTGLESAYLAEISVEDDRQETLVVSNRGELQIPADATLRWQDSMCKRAADAGLWATEDVDRDLPGSPIGAQLAIRSYVTVPILDTDQRPMGTLCAVSRDAVTMSAGVKPALAVLAQLIAEQWNVERLRADQLAEMTSTEALLRDHALRLAESEHQLKSPLAVIDGWAELLTTDWAELTEDGRQNGLRTIRRAVTRAVRQVEELLDGMGEESLARELPADRVDLTALLRRLAGQLEGVRHPDQRVVAEIEPGLMVTGDPDALWQLVWHLAENAVKYSPDGGTIRIHARAETGTDGDPERVVVLVEDEGLGVPADVDIFTPFVRGPEVEGRIKGTGLGLHIVRQLTTAMGGTVTAEPRPERGSVFTVTLPRRPADVGAGSGADAP